jgi:plasmid stabilization system protein ParE
LPRYSIVIDAHEGPLHRDGACGNRGIFSYIAGHSPRAAAAVVEQIEQTIELIGNIPEIGTLKIPTGRANAAGPPVSSLSRILCN